MFAFMTSTAISTDEFKLIQAWIEKECGISMGEDKAYLIESRLARLMVESMCDTYREFYFKISLGNDALLKAKIIDAVTTNETLWFRDESPFAIFKDILFPQFDKELALGKRTGVKVWSAACSTGQEPYSLSMTQQEYLRQCSGSNLKGAVSILATDISNSALMLAKSGRYDDIAISRGLPECYKTRYFKQEGRLNIVNTDIRESITFQPLNLQNSFLPLGKFDVVLMRNVAIYFSQQFKAELIKKISNCLNPGGILILGASESLSGITHDFELKEHGRGLYYQLKGGSTSAIGHVASNNIASHRNGPAVAMIR
jgi:chemotaxis protein methyltransferase CheR